ncbi:hypothetical protein EJB05_01510, partial [Eragrostis curvula]
MGIRQPSAEKTSPSKSFQRPWDSSGKFPIITRYHANSLGYLENDRLTVECAITVFKDPEAIPVLFSDLPKDFGELLRSEAGADVMFIVSGESIATHKNVLAARSSVFMAEFFGEMKEKTSQCIEIKEMEAAVFKAMLGFIYTDTVPDLDEKHGHRLALDIDVGTVSTTLVLAEQHGCSQLKAKRIEFIVEGSPQILGAVLATEGFKSLEASLLTELFMAARGGSKK